MCKFYNHKIIAQLHQNHGGNWSRIQRDYLIITNHDVNLRNLRDAHHYWSVRNRVNKIKGNNKYDRQVINRLVGIHGLNRQLIYKEYCVITNKDIPKNNFIFLVGIM